MGRRQRAQRDGLGRVGERTISIARDSSWTRPPRALAQAGPWFSELGLYIRAVMAVRRGNAERGDPVRPREPARILELQDKFAFVYALVPLAAAAVLKGDDEWAARSLGARDAITERTGAALLDPSVADLREQAERGARARLGPARWARAYEAGRSVTISGLLEQIDAALLP